MLSPFSPLIVHFLLFFGSFILSLVFTGLLISFLHHNVKPSKARSLKYVPLLAAAPLSGIILFLLLGGGMLAFSRVGEEESWGLLLPGIWGSGILLILGNLGTRFSFGLPRFVGINALTLGFLIGLSGTILLFQVPADLMIFKGAFSFAFDRFFASLMLVGITLLFCRGDQVSGLGFLGLALFGIGLITLPFGVEAAGFLGRQFNLLPDDMSAPIIWPSGWFGLGLLLAGAGGGVFYWALQGFALHIGLSGRLALGFLLGWLLLQLTLLTSGWVTLLLLLLPISVYGLLPISRTLWTKFIAKKTPLPLLFVTHENVVKTDGNPSVGRRFISRPHKLYLPLEMIPLIIAYCGFIGIASLAYFWPLFSLIVGGGWGMVFLLRSRRENSHLISDG